MRSMSSTDTPLNTVHLLQEKQKVDKLPYIVLSGGKGIAAYVSTAVNLLMLTFSAINCFYISL